MEEKNESYNYYSDHEITIKFVKDEYWDNWGTLVKVFSKGDVVKATLHHGGSVSAESPYYPGVSDFVSLGSFKIIVQTSKSER